MRYLSINDAKPLIAAIALTGLTLSPLTVSADAMTIINDNVGIGTSLPDGILHIFRDDGSSPNIVIETDASAGISAKWEIKSNPITGRLTFKDLNGTSGPNGGPTTPFKFSPTAVENLFRVGIPSSDTVSIAGNLVITGSCTANGNGACADYVFDPDYQLRPIDELNQFIKENQHLPNVPSADTIKNTGVNMADFSGRLLEKIEELTLYTIQQEDTISQLKDLIDQQSELVKAQDKRLRDLEIAR